MKPVAHRDAQGRRPHGQKPWGRAALLSFLAVLILAPGAWAGTVSPSLDLRMKGAGSATRIPVIITLPDGAAPGSVGMVRGKTARKKATARALAKAASGAQAPLLAALGEKAAQGTVEAVRPLWITNAVAAEITPAAIADLVRRFPDIEIIEDAPVRIPVNALAGGGGGSGSPPDGWNLTAIDAQNAWSAGYRGEGIVVASMDSGVDPRHPDLEVAAYKGGDDAWCDVSGTGTTCAGLAVPADTGTQAGHGTGVMGLMVGGATSGAGTDVGVAPGAMWVAVRIFDAQGNANLSDALEGLQFLLGLPTPPDIINMSWELADVNAGNSCTTMPTLHTAIQNLRTAGVFLVAASGNNSIAQLPAGYPEVFAVGATNQTGYPWDFSGVGPTTCLGRGLTFPDKPYPNAVAPGDPIVTTDLSTGGLANYQTRSGTSFAAPHASGAAAVVLSAYPSLTVDELETALHTAAIATGGQTQIDETYGYGRIQVNGTITHLSTTTRPARPHSLRVALTGGGYQLYWGAVPDPGSGVTYKVLRDGTEIATGVSATQHLDTGAVASPVYTVIAVDAAIPARESDPATARLGNVNKRSAMSQSRVDAFDLAALTQMLGTNTGSANWNPVYDLNDDGSVDAQDTTILEAQLGLTGG